MTNSGRGGFTRSHDGVNTACQDVRVTEPGTEPSTRADEVAVSLRTPRAAAVAGLGFTVLMVASAVCLRQAIPANVAELAAYTFDDRSTMLVRIGATLAPFAGICFLWFIGVIRTQLGAREDRLFATVFLGSGLLLVAMIFVSTAIAVGILAVVGSGVEEQGPLVVFAGSLWNDLLTSYGARMAGVFTLSVCTLGRRTGVISRWLVVLGYLAGLAMMIAPLGVPYVEVLFPAWVGVFSVSILVRTSAHRSGPADAALV